MTWPSVRTGTQIGTLDSTLRESCNNDWRLFHFDRGLQANATLAPAPTTNRTRLIRGRHLADTQRGALLARGLPRTDRIVTCPLSTSPFPLGCVAQEEAGSDARPRESVRTLCDKPKLSEGKTAIGVKPPGVCPSAIPQEPSSPERPSCCSGLPRGQSRHV